MNEIWVPINGWNGKYFISNTGKVKSIDGKFKKACPEGYVTNGCIEKSTGYRVVTLRNRDRKERYRIHVLVANHFKNSPNLKHQCVNHIDGDKLNNHESNLEFTTLGDNVKHAVKTGLMDFKGEKHPCNKLTEENVVEIRRMYRSGITQEFIGRIYEVSRRQIGDIINGVNWGWLRYGL